MDVVILAAGKGTRLLPLTANRPKPMIPIINKPLLEYFICRLNEIGAERIFILVEYIAEAIEQYFGDGKNWGQNLVYCRNNERYGTAGAVKKIVKKLSSPFLVLSADLLTDINLPRFVEKHHSSDAYMSMALSNVTDIMQYGVVLLNKNGYITKFLEKPKREEAFSNLVNAGIYIFNADVFKYVPKDKCFDFSKDLFPKLLSMNVPIAGYSFSEYWNDVGRPSSYLSATNDAIAGRVHTIGMKKIHEHAGPGGILITGNHCRIGRSINTSGFAVIGDNVKIGKNVNLHRSVIWDKCVIGDNVTLNEAIVGENVKIGDSTQIKTGAILGDMCMIGDNCEIGQNVHLWCNSRIGSHTVVVD